MAVHRPHQTQISTRAKARPARGPGRKAGGAVTSSFLACLCALWIGSGAAHAGGTSLYPVRLEDPGAVYLTADQFPVAADGVADDSDALQRAIDQVAARNQAGVLFVPRGIYRFGKTVYVWPGVRLIGYGEKRPVFVLGENTPGFQEGDGKYMLFFSGGRGRGDNDRPRDGSPGTFYSALSNIDIEIREGNPAAVGIRFHVAQHCFLSHMEFRLGSARAGVEDIGNEVEDLRFWGGQHAILSGRSAPGWPILVMDCSFQDQSVAAIRSNEAGLAVVRPRFKHLPTAISMAPGKADQLWVSDAVLENITGPAFVVSRENNVRTQINLENVNCTEVPTLVQFRESGELIQRAEPGYVVDRFSHGLHLGAVGATREIKTTLAVRPSTTPPAAVPSDIPGLPPGKSWVNVRTLGVRGDGANDDTGALQEAIAKHRTLYLPLGVYRVSNTLRLRPDTVLVGLNPSATVIHLPNDTPAFQDPGSPKAVIEAPPGGSNILSGIGIYASPLNPAAVAVKWMAGRSSLMNDVRLHGGHGTRLPGGTGDSRGRDHRNRWDTQYPSLWVTAGGGGVFKDIWTPSPYAKAGMLISNTSTSGRVYAMSAEHHVSNEVIIRNASNWRFYALQFEEEREEGPRTLPLQIENSSHLLFANTFFYRVVSSFVPQPHAIRVSGSSDIRLRNTHVYSNSKVSFDNSVFDADAGMGVRDSEFAVLDVTGEPSAVPNEPRHGVVAQGAKVEKLADGFFNISGAAVDGRGDVYFADPREFQIYRWSTAQRRIKPVCKVPERPEQLAFDQAGNLLIIAYEGNGTVLSWNPEDPDTGPRKLEAQPAQVRSGRVPVLPVNRWMGVSQFRSDSTMRKPYHYVSPDGTTFIPAGADFTTGSVSWSVKLADLLRAFALAPASGGRRFYVSNEAELQTWSFQVGPDGTLTDPKVFVEEGGEGVAVDDQGRVYIVAGQIRVFSPSGEPIDVIEIPQRPICLVFGGADRKTLFVTARSSLYSVRLR
jgi:sugar lactone lactonase YvrE